MSALTNYADNYAVPFRIITINQSLLTGPWAPKLQGLWSDVTKSAKTEFNSSVENLTVYN